MKRFIFHTIVFSFIFTGVIIGTNSILSKYVSRNATFSIPHHITNVLLGHSHTECAFNDSLIQNTINLAQSGESYLYTYIKCKNIIDENPHITNVFIEYTNNQITTASHEFIWSNQYLEYRYPLYSPFMSMQDVTLLAQGNPKGFIRSYIIGLKTFAKQIVANDFEYIPKMGGFLPLERMIPENDRGLTVPIFKVFEITQKYIIPEFSDINLQYLRKTIDVCKKNNVQVFLIRSPLHSHYSNYTHEPAFNMTLQLQFADVPFLDFAAFPLQNKHFADLQHLNKNGANIFSVWFNEYLLQR